MKLKTKICLLAGLVVCFAASLFAGCKIGDLTQDDYLNNSGAREQCVTYHGNGGLFKENNRDKMDVYFVPDSYIISTNNLNNFEFVRNEYSFDAWYYAEVDADGKLVCDADGNAVLGKKVEATDKISAGQHLHVAAKWNANVKIEIYLVTDGFNVEDKDGNIYKSGDLLKTSSTFGGLNQGQHAIAAKNATYLAFYADEECTRLIQTLSRPEDAGSENVQIYVKYLEGNWTVVSNAGGVRDMLDGYSGGGRYYLFTPDGSNKITYSGRNLTLKQGGFNATIAGNGVVIENLTFTSTGLSGGDYAVWGAFTEKADVSNLTLKNLKINVTVLSGNVNLYLAFSGYAAGAKVSGVTFEQVEYEISASSNANVNNVQRGDGFTDENWLFGGFASDDEFISETGGISVKNVSLKLNGTAVAENISK